MEELDVIVVGAGLSGIAAAWHLQAHCPDRSFVLLEGRDAIGGTWDLFRYPGVRSDSDMFTLGYSFRPWTSERVIAEGAAIRDYVRETARTFGIDSRIRFGHRVTAAQWSTPQARWTVTVATAEGERQLRCRFLFFCSGYYDYAQGHAPAFPGQDDFRGAIVHPQHWPEGLDYAGKRVVVIGSGATAVTLVPKMAARTAHVTMLQRSPSWIVPVPARDRIGAAVQRVLPRRLAWPLVRWKNILLAMAVFQFARRRPRSFERVVLGYARRRLPGFDVERHLLPRYAPWDQRLCIVPDADLFKALAAGRASIVTDEIQSFTPTGIRLASGAELPADLVVSATGLRLQMLGGTQLTVDGEPVNLSQRVAYRGALCEGVPNLALAMGYTNASWTLKAELIARYVCRLLNHMRAHGEDFCVPVQAGPRGQTRPALDLSSGYIQRAVAVLPRQGERKPWRMLQNYLQDIVSLRLSRLRDGALRFGRAGRDDGVPSATHPTSNPTV